MDNQAQILKFLNADTAETRLDNLRGLIASEKAKPEERPQYANNHIHTIYSFSPYSPSAAVYFARQAGLTTAGIMDHDTIAGAKEFQEAGRIAGVAVTCGMECRVDFSQTSLTGRRLNNPDQDGIAYMAVHSVPPQNYGILQEAFAPLRERRNKRNIKMVQNINSLMNPHGISLDFEKDVLPESQYAWGGTVTERHLLWALAVKLIEAGGAEEMAGLLAGLGVALNEGQLSRLSADNPHLRYDLLGILKAELIGKIYVPAFDECMTLNELVKLAKRADAILCYAYLGDVGDSVTGDKRPERYEDSYLDELFAVLKQEGVSGVTYMPSRNTSAQIARLRELCAAYGMIEISGEDINSPKQSFICEKLSEPGFSHLVQATWRLIERER